MLFHNPDCNISYLALARYYAMQYALPVCHSNTNDSSLKRAFKKKKCEMVKVTLYINSVVSQPVCRGTLVCRKAHLGVPRNFMTINKRFRKISSYECRMKYLILKSLHLLYENIKKYLPSLDVSSTDWVRNPFIDSAYETTLFTTDEESELIDIKNDRGLKLQYSKLVEDIARESKLKKIKINVNVSSFWINLLHEYPKISRKAMNAILPFSTSYICEAALSSMNAIKTKNRSQLKNLEDDMRVCLSTIRPRRNPILKRKHDKCAAAKYGLGLVCREGKRLGNAVISHYNLKKTTLSLKNRPHNVRCVFQFGETMDLYL
ncbi:hypothetical protein QTP88_014969 [Uroleucon formosanum]